MKNTLLALVVALLATFMFAGGASANQWYIETGAGKGVKRHVEDGETVRVPVSGAVTVKAKVTGGKATSKTKCELAGSAELTNEPGEATSEITGLSFSECTEGGAVTAITPWPAQMLGPGDPFDNLTGTAIELSIGGVAYGAFSGSLEASLGDCDAATVSDDFDPTQHWKAGEGELVGPGGSVELAGTLRFGVKNVDQAEGVVEGVAEARCEEE